jgi:hypothetical protein
LWPHGVPSLPGAHLARNPHGRLYRAVNRQQILPPRYYPTKVLNNLHLSVSNVKKTTLVRFLTKLLCVFILI